MTVATRSSTGLDITDAIESYRRNRRVRLSPQTLDRLYVPRLLAFAAWLRAQGMPTDVGAIRREHVEAYIEWLQREAPGRSGAGQKSATSPSCTARSGRSGAGAWRRRRSAAHRWSGWRVQRSRRRRRR